MADFPDNVVYKIKGFDHFRVNIWRMELMVESPELRENTIQSSGLFEKESSPELCSKYFSMQLRSFIWIKAMICLCDYRNFARKFSKKSMS